MINANSNMRQLLLSILILLQIYGHVTAQKNTIAGDTMAIRLLTQAIPQIQAGGKYAIYFDKIAYQLKDPLLITTLPGYAYHTGGYMLMDGNKLEMKTGVLQAISDGKLTIIMNHADRTVIVDSIRKFKKEEYKQYLMAAEAGFEKRFKNATYSNAGTQKIGQQDCYKIKAIFPAQKNMESIYWVRKEDSKLLGWADKQNGKYDVYLVREITIPPAAHNYVIKNIPNNKMKAFQGYEIVDFREMYRMLSQRPIKK